MLHFKRFSVDLRQFFSVIIFVICFLGLAAFATCYAIGIGNVLFSHAWAWLEPALERFFTIL